MSKEKGNKCLLRDIEKNDYETKYNGNLTCPKWVFCQNYIYLEKCKYFNFLVHGIKKENYIIKIAHILLSIKELKVDRS